MTAPKTRPWSAAGVRRCKTVLISGLSGPAQIPPQLKPNGRLGQRDGRDAERAR